MKNIKKILFTLLVLILPFSVSAASLSADKESVTVKRGETTTVTVTANECSGVVNVSSSDTNAATVSPGSLNLNNESKTITITGVSEGSSNIVLTPQTDPETSEITIPVTVTKSSNNKLSNIKIDGNNLTGFSSTTYSYTLNTTNSQISIQATVEDSMATILSGNGTKSLTIGKNTLSIVVKAEDGSQQTYTLEVNRTDNRESNNYLKSLTVDKGTLDFNKGTLNYTVNVDSTIDKITISAQPEGTRATVGGTGEKTLKMGENTFNVVVTAENESTRTYVIVVNRVYRKDSNTYLSSLTVNKGTLSFNKNIYNYNVTVETNIDKITVTATAESPKATVDNPNKEYSLKLGYNKIVITVTAENGDKKSYTITVYRDDPRDSNNFLSSLMVDVGNLSPEFSKTTMTYIVNVENTVEKITVTATAESDAATIKEGNGTFNLKEGSNKIKVVVAAENEAEKTYNITVNRAKKDASIDEIDNITYVNSLSIEEVDFLFNPSVLEYNISIPQDVNKLTFSYVTPEDVVVTEEGNDSLENNSVVRLVFTKGEYSKEYSFLITKFVPTKDKDKGQWFKNLISSGNLKWIIIGVLVLALIIVYGIMRDNKIKKEKSNTNNSQDVNSNPELDTLKNEVNTGVITDQGMTSDVNQVNTDTINNEIQNEGVPTGSYIGIDNNSNANQTYVTDNSNIENLDNELSQSTPTVVETEDAEVLDSLEKVINDPNSNNQQF